MRFSKVSHVSNSLSDERVMKRLILITYAILSSLFFVDAQTTKEAVMGDLNKAGSNYCVYSKQSDERTPVPKGYKPFYISHYGRHGSRYYISDNEVRRMYELLNTASKANALTQLGSDVKMRFFALWQDIQDRASDLTSLGMSQHAGIAERMYQDYPTVFTKNAFIEARSTPRSRCVLSMSSFVMRLKELNPKMNVSMNASNFDAKYLSPEDERARDARMKDSLWNKTFGQFHYEHIHPERLVASIFSDNEYVSKNIDKVSFMRKLYDISCSLQGLEHLDITLNDLFTPEELFENWQVQNAWWYAFAGPCPLNGKDTPYEEVPLLKKMMEDAQAAINGGVPQAHLRFGHDIPLMGLLALMHIENCYVEETDLNKLYTKWCDFKIIPMASNIQIVFYKKKSSDPILVKFLLNEKEVSIPCQTNTFPYYVWDDVVNYFSAVMDRK